MTTPKVDGSRLWAALEALGAIGSYLDERTGLRGVNRLALTAADGEGRRHVAESMRKLGLTVTIDRIGNVFGRRAGREDELAPIMMGSHIDSVPTGGRFDGCLGVLGGLEVIQAIADAGVTTRRPLVAAFFTDEEGARFGTDMLGSAVATGRLPLEVAYGLVDRDGKRLKDELAAIGFLGTADEKLTRPPHAYVETHVEQGPVLAAAGTQIGVVTGVQSISWHEVTIVGKSAHAGTTPMELRADAGVAAAKINLELRALIASGKYGAMRATMGAIVPHPGLVNIVPGRLVCSVDLRNPDGALMRASEAAVLAAYARIAREEKVEITWRQTARTEPVDFHPRIQAMIATAATQRGLSHAPIISGAGHDAQELAAVCPTAMVFVPGEHEGISHNPREYSTPKACEDGVAVMLDVVLALADEP